MSDAAAAEWLMRAAIVHAILETATRPSDLSRRESDAQSGRDDGGWPPQCIMHGEC
jgi:hypothetical protein